MFAYDGPLYICVDIIFKKYVFMLPMFQLCQAVPVMVVDLFVL